MTASRDRFDTLVKHFAAALGARGIRVNAVAPGLRPALANWAILVRQISSGTLRVARCRRAIGHGRLGRQSRRRPGAVGWEPRKRG
jgi:NAD(P)-dependent dehydrogenase (short-subunit alcohol dehydrogenase family)